MPEQYDTLLMTRSTTDLLDYTNRHRHMLHEKNEGGRVDKLAKVKGPSCMDLEPQPNIGAQEAFISGSLAVPQDFADTESIKTTCTIDDLAELSQHCELLDTSSQFGGVESISKGIFV